MSKFEVKDSGKRQDYPSGMRRDTQDGKTDYSLLNESMLTRWAAHITKGAEKYGRRNYELANSEEEMERFTASAFRHFVQWWRGDRDEDHGAAVFFNIAAAEMVRSKLEKEKTAVAVSRTRRSRWGFPSMGGTVEESFR